MRKILCALSAVIMTLGVLAACGNDDVPPEPPPEAPTPAPEQAPPPVEPASEPNPELPTADEPEQSQAGLTLDEFLDDF